MVWPDVPNPKIWLNLYELHNQNLQKNCQLIVEVYDSAAALQLATLFSSQIAHLLLVLMLPLH